MDVQPSTNAGRQVVLLAAPMDEARQMLDAWLSEDPDGRHWSALHAMAVG